jgi:hypothetical protein
MADFSPAWLAALDPGIAVYVGLLDAAGVETFESCDGGPGHAFAEPTIRFHGERGEGFRALAVALQHRLPVRGLRRYWQVSDQGEPEGPHWELTFATFTGAGRPGTADARQSRESCAQA